MRRALREPVRIVRYAAALPGALRQRVGTDEAQSLIRQQLAARDASFVAILERTVYGHPRSPYRALLLNAGFELGDAVALVRERGLEDALERLHEEGVFVTLEEFKGRRPIERPGLSLEPRPEDFDGLLLGPALASRTGGSSSSPRRVMSGLGHRAQQAIYHRLVLDTFGLGGRPVAVWRPAPPGMAGLGGVLGFVMAGQPVERWFSQSRAGRGKDGLLTRYAVLAGRLAGTRIPFPEYVPVSDATPVARWLEAKRRAGTPALLNTTPSSGVRACLAAERHGLDISGSFFRLGGEPYTAGKAAVVEQSGVQAISNYTMSELGRVGIACATPQALDDLHMLTNALAVIQRSRTVAAGGAAVDTLLYTTLRPNAPKVMINVESDDYGVLERRECGCLLGELGLSTHVSSIRSYEKLTSEGMTFLGSELIALIDEQLPARFGGRPTDYQLVEEEVDGLPKVTVVVSPSVGEVDEAAVLEAVLQALAVGPGYKAMMAEVWREGETLRVERREPFVTPGGKVFPLHSAGTRPS